MFEDLYDKISLLWSWRWPETIGDITAVDIERIKDSQGNVTLQLAIAYKFSIGDDGPYTGESFWQPAFCSKKRVMAARRCIRIHQQVPIRYRPDDPSVNRLNGNTWQSL
jgi:hypothetical protein